MHSLAFSYSQRYLSRRLVVTTSRLKACICKSLRRRPQLTLKQEQVFVPYPLHVLRNQGGTMYHTKPLPIPGSKSEIQRISSWMESLIYLQTTLNRYDDAPDALLNKTKWVSDKLLSLEQGVVVLIRKMLDERMMSSIFERTLTPYDEPSPEMPESVLRDYNLLICFRKDAHKMETFLKLQKCRQSNKLSCLSY